MAYAMTPADFLPLIEEDLRARCRPYDRAELLAFVEAAWPLIEDAPDVPRWAAAFLEARRRAAGA
jgi:hypothetical protein